MVACPSCLSLVTRPFSLVTLSRDIPVVSERSGGGSYSSSFDYLIVDVDTRSYNSFHGKMDDKETEDLIRGKEGTSTR